MIVRAESAASARLAAAHLDTPDEASEFSQQRPQPGSAFHSPRLYTVRRVESDDYGSAKPAGVLDAERR